MPRFWYLPYLIFFHDGGLYVFCFDIQQGIYSFLHLKFAQCNFYAFMLYAFITLVDSVGSFMFDDLFKSTNKH